MKKLNVLSLFGGIECGRIALERAGFEIGEYYSSEVDPYAIKITTANYPDIRHIGDIEKIAYNDGVLKWLEESTIDKKHKVILHHSRVTGVDLMIGGSPCQDLSIAKSNGKGLEGEKSGLFYEYVRLLREVKPKYFLLENVASMKKEHKDKITEVLREIYPDTEIHMINSAFVSAQNRKRLYWTNIPGVKIPEDKGICIQDILEDPNSQEIAGSWKPLPEKYITEKFLKKMEDRQKTHAITATYASVCPRDFFDKSNRELIVGVYQIPRWKNDGGIVQNGIKAPTVDVKSYRDNNLLVWQFRRGDHLRIHADQVKIPTLTSNMGTGGNNVPILIESSERESSYKYFWRKLTPIECERLQTLPDWYTAHVSNSRRYKAIGNGWTVDVIAHILSFILWSITEHSSIG